MNNKTSPSSPSATVRHKKPYVAPAIVQSEAFERLALACTGNETRTLKSNARSCTGQVGS